MRLAPKRKQSQILLSRAVFIPASSEHNVRASELANKRGIGNNMKKQKLIKMGAMLALTLTVVSAQGALAAGRQLVPLGCTMGILINTQGVLVSSLAATQDGQSPSPAEKAGLAAGDLITSMNGTEIKNAADFTEAAAKLTGETVEIGYERNGEAKTAEVTPDCASGKPELGMWLRDGVTGVGTMTYYDPATGEYGGLGHSICDAQSGAEIPLGSGSVFSSSVVEVVRGSVGTPGQLHGIFDLTHADGSIVSNSVVGIFGSVTGGFEAAMQPMEVADESEIETGKATILSNVSGTQVSEYDIEITRVNTSDGSGRCIMLKVTDPELIDATGGIVQGMSGSPIIQNGMLVGAVTHVTVSDPTKGFGVSAERMLRESDSLKTAENAA